MEDVLDVYTRPYDPRRPQVCLDETSRQLLAEVRDAAAAGAGAAGAPGRRVRAAGGGQPVRRLRAAAGLARRCGSATGGPGSTGPHCVKELVDVHYPRAAKVVLVQDNLNTHTPASLYEAFPPAEAKRLADKLEIHYTPKHGSWLNMAEIELSVLDRQCLDRRLADRATLEREVAPGSSGATPPRPPSTGASPPRTPASSSSASTP